MYLDRRYISDRDPLHMPSRSLNAAMLVDEHILLQERFWQFEALMGYLRLQGHLSVEVVAEAKRRFPSIPSYEVDFMAKNLQRVAKDHVLLNAIIMGGETMVSSMGMRRQIYPLQRSIGVGGMGAIYEAYFESGSSLEPAIVKQFTPTPISSLASRDHAIYSIREAGRRDNHRMEACNIKRFFPRPRPGFVKPLFVGKRKHDTDDLLVYERICALDGRSYDLSEVSTKRLLPPSAIINAVAHAAYHLEGLHQDGIVHGDLTLLNIFLNQRGEGIIGDLCTLFSLRDPVWFQRNASDRVGYLLSHVDLGSGVMEFDIPNNPSYFDSDLVEKALQRGNSLKVVDYLTLGTGILRILEDQSLLVRSSSGWDYAPWLHERCAAGFPIPPALVDLVALAYQLRAIDTPNLSVSLITVSKILQDIVTGFQESIDPLYNKQ